MPGHPMTAETRAKISATMKGIKRSPETRKKMSIAKMGNQNKRGKSKTRPSPAPRTP